MRLIKSKPKLFRKINTFFLFISLFSVLGNRGNIYAQFIPDDSFLVCEGESPGTMGEEDPRNLYVDWNLYHFNGDIPRGETFIRNISGLNSVDIYDPGPISHNSLFSKSTTFRETGERENFYYAIYVINPNKIFGKITSDQTITSGNIPERLALTEEYEFIAKYPLQWQEKELGGNWVDINNATSATYQPRSISRTTYYRIKVTLSCGNMYTDYITIESVSSISSDKIDVDKTTICHEGDVHLSGHVISIQGARTEYDWQQSVDGSTWSSFGSNIASITYTNATNSTVRYFRRRVRIYGNSDNSLLNQVTSNVIEVDVQDPIDRGAFRVITTSCYGQPIPGITATRSPSGGTPPYSYQWEYTTNHTSFGDDVVWQPAANGNEESLLNPQEILYGYLHYRRYVTDSNGCRALNTFNRNKAGEEVLPGTITTDNEIICTNERPTEIICSEQQNAQINLWENKTGDVIYQWEISNDGTNWSEIGGQKSINYAPVTINQKTYYRRKMYGVICGPFYSNVKTVDVYPAVITGNVSADQTICYNTKPSVLSIQKGTGGTGTYTYQWQNMVEGTSWKDIEGATERTYTPDNLIISTSYRIKVTSCETEYSDPIEITVLDEFITGSKSDNQTICYNTVPEELSIQAATGANGVYSYQWQSSTDNINYRDLIAQTNLNYRSSNLSETTFYRVEITNATCGEIKYIDPIKITVLDELVSGNANGNQDICYNTSPDEITIEDMLGGTGTYTYQWRKSSDGTSFNPVVGATTQNLQPPTLSNTTYYQRSTYNQCGDILSPIITINVSDEITIGNISEPQTVCYSVTPSVLTCEKAEGGIGSFTYQWIKSSNQILWDNISGATNLTYLPQAPSEKVYYKLKATNSYCGEITSSETYVEVKGELEASSIGSSQVIVYNTVPQALNSTNPVTGGSGDYTFQWQQSTNGILWTNIISGTNESYAPQSLTQTTYFRRITLDNQCGNVTSNVAEIIVGNETAIVGEIGSNQTICYGYQPQKLVNVKNGTGIASEQWQSSTDGENWNNIIGEVEKDYQPDNLELTTYYRKKVLTGGNGELYTNIIKITVEQQLDPGSISGDQEICLGSNASIITTETIPNASTFKTSWEQSNDGSNWLSIGEDNSDNLTLPPLSESIYIRKAVESTCNKEYTNTVFIKINPALTPGVIESNQNVAYNTVPEEIKGTYPTGGDNNYTYEWEKSFDTDNWVKIPSSNIVDYQPTVVKETTYFRRLVSSNGCGTIPSNEVVISVAEELVSGQIGNNQTICYNAIPALIQGTEATGGIGIYSYVWERSIDGETWEQLFGKTLKNLLPTKEVTKTTYFRRKVVSGTDEAISNIVRIDHLPEVITPEINYDSRYCKGDQISIASNLNKVLWYDKSMNLISSQTTLSINAAESMKYYYQIENDLGCKGDLKELDITVDFVETNIESNAINNNSVENGKKLIISPNVESNFASSELNYTWTFSNKEYGWYETMFDEIPSQYFHWKGWYDISLVTETPTGCKSTFNVESLFFVNEETLDTRAKSAFTGRKAVGDEFGKTNQTISTSTYPNPVKDKLYIKLENTKDKVSIVLYNTSGKVIYSGIIAGGQLNISTLDMSSYSPGVYILVIDNKYQHKIIK